VAIAVLKPEVINQRNKQNALSLKGCLCTALFKVFYFMGMGLLYFVVEDKALVRDIAIFLKFYDYVLIPLVQIKTSPPLKKYAEQNFKGFLTPSCA